MTASIDYSTVLACAVHDMKNSLCMLLQSIDKMQQHQLTNEQQLELAQLHYEASRLNSNMLQLLAFYRAKNQQLPLAIEQYYLDEFIDELIAKNELYIQSRSIQVAFDITPDLSWYFDHDLILNLVNDVFVNALRYCHQQILLKAYISDKFLCLEVHDDGPGYPESMLDNVATPQPPQLSSGRTGLGLYFARMIANAHVNKQRNGVVNLSNDSQLGGSKFSLLLP